MKAIFKKLTIVVLCFVMVFAISVPAFAVQTTKFVDVKETAWYYKAVNYVAEKEIMTGTSGTTFAPKDTLSRAMTVQILATMAKVDLSKYKSAPFADVPQGRWYTGAVAWAAENGIVKGTSETTFSPKDPVTREALAIMIYSFNKIKPISFYSSYAPTEKDLSTFADADKVHTWASEALQWAVNNGILSGDDKGNVNPRGEATRAQAAVIFYNVDYVLSHHYLPFNTSEAETITVKESNSVRVVCWGDSLTAGYVPPTYTGIECPYPEALAKISGLNVLNYGISSELSNQIAMRQGGISVFALPFTIPADTSKVEILPIDENGDEAPIGYYSGTIQQNKFSKYYGYKGINEVSIGGVKGKLIVDKSADRWYFQRSEAGEEVRITAPTQIITYAMTDQYKNDVLVIFSGSNDYSFGGTIEEIIENQQKMIKYANTDRYIIISFTAKNLPIRTIDEDNEMLAETYGDHYVDVRSHFLDLSENGALAEAGITPTEQDIADIEVGNIPTSLLSDFLHGNNIFYYQIAEMVYAKMIELGYVD